MKWAHEITNGRGLLQAEPDCHGQVHRHGFAVERCGLVFPLFQSVLSSLMKQRGAGNDVHGRHASGGVDQRVDENVARNMLALGEHWICWRHRKNQSCRFDVSANGKRRCGRRRLFVASNKTGSERFYAGPRLSIAA